MKITDWQSIVSRITTFCMKLQHKGYHISPDFLNEDKGKSVVINFYDEKGVKKSYQTRSSEDYQTLISELKIIIKEIEGELK